MFPNRGRFYAVKILKKYKTIIHGQEVEVTRYEAVEGTDNIVTESELDSFEGEAEAPKQKRKAVDLVEEYSERFIWDSLTEEEGEDE
jgi:hypothetical protein